jgi:hypothetical protein
MFAITREQPLDDIVKSLTALAYGVYFGFSLDMDGYRRAIFTFHIFLRVRVQSLAQWSLHL